jgi:hypothetical protein
MDQPASGKIRNESNNEISEWTQSESTSETSEWIQDE